MLTQILTKPATLFNAFAALPPSDAPLAQPIQASSRDYGFDLDEEEIARELITPLPASLGAASIPEVDADEFVSRYLSFLS